MTIDCDTEYAAVTATSLDGAAIGESRRVLLTCVARAENTAQGFWPPTAKQQSWSHMSWMLPAEGRIPVITEPVKAEISIRVPGKAVVYALDASGKQVERIECTSDAKRLRMDPSQARSIWCEVVVSQ
jgi:hypothetical protein